MYMIIHMSSFIHRYTRDPFFQRFFLDRRIVFFWVTRGRIFSNQIPSTKAKFRCPNHLKNLKKAAYFAVNDLHGVVPRHLAEIYFCRWKLLRRGVIFQPLLEPEVRGVWVFDWTLCRGESLMRLRLETVEFLKR